MLGGFPRSCHRATLPALCVPQLCNPGRLAIAGAAAALGVGVALGGGLGQARSDGQDASIVAQLRRCSARLDVIEAALTGRYARNFRFLSYRCLITRRGSTTASRSPVHLATRMSVAQLAAKLDELVAACPSRTRPLIVGIAGVPGGGKSTVVGPILGCSFGKHDSAGNSRRSRLCRNIYRACTERTTWPVCPWVRTDWIRGMGSLLPSAHLASVCRWVPLDKGHA